MLDGMLGQYPDAVCFPRSATRSWIVLVVLECLSIVSNGPSVVTQIGPYLIHRKVVSYTVLPAIRA